MKDNNNFVMKKGLIKPIIRIKRAYDKPLKKDGYRVLVDRLWPRGVRKEEAAFDEWAADLAPSAALRNWWGHDPETWITFKKRYLTELKGNRAPVDFMCSHANKKVITLVYGAKNTECNHALVLQQYLEQLQESK